MIDYGGNAGDLVRAYPNGVHNYCRLVAISDPYTAHIGLQPIYSLGLYRITAQNYMNSQSSILLCTLIIVS